MRLQAQHIDRIRALQDKGHTIKEIVDIFAKDGIVVSKSTIEKRGRRRRYTCTR